jgi:hypothetical protein
MVDRRGGDTKKARRDEAVERGLIDAGADFPAVAGEADLAAFEEIRDGGDGLAIISAITADRENEITQTVIPG